jgi:hypothetical protein
MKNPQANRNENQSFLFVNKTQTSKSLTKSDGAVAKSINSHAQQIRRRKYEAEKINSARNGSSAARRIALSGWQRRQPTEE